MKPRTLTVGRLLLGGFHLFTEGGAVIEVAGTNVLAETSAPVVGLNAARYDARLNLRANEHSP